MCNCLYQGLKTYKWKELNEGPSVNSVGKLVIGDRTIPAIPTLCNLACDKPERFPLLSRMTGAHPFCSALKSYSQDFIGRNSGLK